MAIQVVTTEQSTLFTIRTKHTTYQMKADEYGVLLHLWYGASVEGDMSYLLAISGFRQLQQPMQTAAMH